MCLARRLHMEWVLPIHGRTRVREVVKEVQVVLPVVVLLDHLAGTLREAQGILPLIPTVLMGRRGEAHQVSLNHLARRRFLLLRRLESSVKRLETPWGVITK